MPRSEKQYHHGNLRQALIDEGLARLTAGPETEISLRDLARACGVSANAPYRHFKSRESLLVALRERGFELLSSRLLLAHADGPVKQFREVGQVFADFGKEFPALFRLMFRESVVSGGAEEFSSRSLCFQQICESVRIVMGEVVVNGEVKQHAVAAWSLFSGYTLMAVDKAFPLLESEEPLTCRDAAKILARGLKK